MRTLSPLDALACDAFEHECDTLALMRAEEPDEHVVHLDGVARHAQGRRPQHEGLHALRQGLLDSRLNQGTMSDCQLNRAKYRYAWSEW